MISFFIFKTSSLTSSHFSLTLTFVTPSYKDPMKYVYKFVFYSFCVTSFCWSIQSILKEINPEYSPEGLMLKLKLQYFGHLTRRADSLEKTLMLGKIEGRRRKGWQRMRWVGWYHWFNEREFEQTPGDGDGQESLAYCSPWSHKESDTPEWLSNNNHIGL